jgi:hypothetical protein
LKPPSEGAHPSDITSDYAGHGIQEAPNESPLATIPPQLATVGRSEPGVDIATLRRKLDAAIVAEAWPAVKVIHDLIVEHERAAVVDLAAERQKRGR